MDCVIHNEVVNTQVTPREFVTANMCSVEYRVSVLYTRGHLWVVFLVGDSIQVNEIVAEDYARRNRAAFFSNGHGRCLQGTVHGTANCKSGGFSRRRRSYDDSVAEQWNTRYKLKNHSVSTLLTGTLNEIRAISESFGNCLAAADQKSTGLLKAVSSFAEDSEVNSNISSGNIVFVETGCVFGNGARMYRGYLCLLHIENLTSKKYFVAG